MRLWKDMEKRWRSGSKPRLLYSESDLLVRALRDLLTTDIDEIVVDNEAALTRAADRGVRGALVQILDPQEEAFPFDGRTIFESMGGTLRHETLKAGDLRTRYLSRLAERKDRLAHLARLTGWQVLHHHTGNSASAALLWIYGALERRA